MQKTFQVKLKIEEIVKITKFHKIPLISLSLQQKTCSKWKIHKKSQKNRSISIFQHFAISL